MSEAGEGQEVLHGTPGTAKRHSLRMSRHVADRQGAPVRANPHCHKRCDERAVKGGLPKTPPDRAKRSESRPAFSAD